MKKISMKMWLTNLRANEKNNEVRVFNQMALILFYCDHSLLNRPRFFVRGLYLWPYSLNLQSGTQAGPANLV